MSLRLSLLGLTLAALAGACHHGGGGHGRGHDRAVTPPAASSHHGAPLGEAAIAVPIRAGQTAAWEAKLAELTGPRYDEYEASRRRFGLTSQSTFLQSTPMGDFALIHLTGPDVGAAFHAMSASPEPWDVSWRAMTKDLHGIDFATAAAPVVEPGFATDERATLAPSTVFVVPLAPDAIDRFRAIAAELRGPRHAAYVAARAAIGVRREATFLQITSAGAGVVVTWEADDPAASLRALTASRAPFDRWLAEATRALHPVALADVATIVSANRRVGQFPRAR